MNRSCIRPECPYSNPAAPTRDSAGPTKKRIVRNGFFYRKSDHRKILRYRCTFCQTQFSTASRSSCYRQKKRQINASLNVLLCSGISQRRAALYLGVNPKTVVRRFRFLSAIAKKQQSAWIASIPQQSIKEIQFDDLETSEHSKCKPLSVALAVEPKSRKILSFQVSQMPAKGHLAAIAKKKYGYRRDERGRGWRCLFQELKPIVSPHAHFKSDENPHYPKHILRCFPDATHTAVKGRRGCIAGQGELKKVGFDPLFSLNHTCAMLRANLNRLIRRTWCTTKKRERLADHLALYVAFHNTTITPELRGDS